ncbi:hypothetical protein [Paenibacillus sp. PL91]|uniref:hypothetical protein n=1 Tax=Paenibacillus sp. PL91 TaxID=2729538 RepID=UPI00145DFFBB|nr:hypothetical protein [Paenibacillus sp. PL91]MBC9200592.1 hypothetical protein [Paenibacillus sp. PL91]
MRIQQLIDGALQFRLHVLEGKIQRLDFVYTAVDMALRLNRAVQIDFFMEECNLAIGLVIFCAV